MQRLDVGLFGFGAAETRLRIFAISKKKRQNNMLTGVSFS
jgi:hypothetical protein